MILSMAVTASALRMLSSTGETASVPGSKGRNPLCVPCAKATPASDSSNTWLGGGSVTSCEIWLNSDIILLYEITPQYEITPLTSPLNKGDFIDLLQCRDTRARFLKRRLTQERHAFF